MHRLAVSSASGSPAASHEGHSTSGGWDELFWLGFEQSLTPMALSQDDRTIIAVNRALSNLVGHDARELCGQRSDLLVPSNWRKVADSDWQRLFDRGTVDVTREVLHGSGMRLRVRLNAQRHSVAGRRLTLWWIAEQGLEPRVVSDAARVSVWLSPRELEVVSGLANGKRVREVAADLMISPTTVTTHVRNAMRKLHARSQAHLVAIALSRELVDPNQVVVEARGPQGRRS